MPKGSIEWTFWRSPQTDVATSGHGLDATGGPLDCLETGGQGCMLGTSLEVLMDALMLSRIQFALTIMFHYIFPPLTIGLSVFMVVTEALWLKTGDPLYERMAKFWTKIFAVNFAMG